MFSQAYIAKVLMTAWTTTRITRSYVVAAMPMIMGDLKTTVRARLAATIDDLLRGCILHKKHIMREVLPPRSFIPERTFKCSIEGTRDLRPPEQRNHGASEIEGRERVLCRRNHSMNAVQQPASKQQAKQVLSVSLRVIPTMGTIRALYLLQGNFAQPTGCRPRAIVSGGKCYTSMRSLCRSG
eukprot:2643784-Amphidinium_carterae.2